MLKTSKNPALAKRFLTFMLSPAFQDQIPTKNWMFPVGKTSKPLPAEFAKLVKPAKLLIQSPQTVAKNRKDWIREWRNAMSK